MFAFPACTKKSDENASSIFTVDIFIYKKNPASQSGKLERKQPRTDIKVTQAHTVVVKKDAFIRPIMIEFGCQL